MFSPPQPSRVGTAVAERDVFTFFELAVAEAGDELARFPWLRRSQRYVEALPRSCSSRVHPLGTALTALTQSVEPRERHCRLLGSVDMTVWFIVFTGLDLAELLGKRPCATWHLASGVIHGNRKVSDG